MNFHHHLKSRPKSLTQQVDSRGWLRECDFFMICDILTNNDAMYQRKIHSSPQPRLSLTMPISLRWERSQQTKCGNTTAKLGRFSLEVFVSLNVCYVAVIRFKHKVSNECNISACIPTAFVRRRVLCRKCCKAGSCTSVPAQIKLLSGGDPPNKILQNLFESHPFFLCHPSNFAKDFFNTFKRNILPKLMKNPIFARI